MTNWKQNLKFFIITAAFATLIIIVFFKVFNMVSVSDKDFQTYQQGLKYLHEKDYENAYFNFSNISKTSKIYEISLLREAMCADEVKDTQTAIRKYHSFIERYPDSVFIKKVYYSLGQNYFRENELKKSEKIFNKIKKHPEDDEYTIAANYYLGMINTEKNPQKAKAYFGHYLKDAPDGRFALNCVDEILALKTELTPNENKLIGKTYFLNSKYAQALPYLNKSDMRTNWHYIFTIYQNRGSLELASKIFDEGYTKYSCAIDEKELHKTLEYYASSRGTSEKEGWFRALEKAKANHSRGEDFIMYRLAKFVDAPMKEQLYKDIFRNYPQGDFASNALSNLFWSEYKNRNYVEAQQAGRLHIKNYPNTIAAPKIMFWMGRISELQGRKNEAKGFYQRILEDYPDDYYAYRASKKLEYFTSSTTSPWRTKPHHRLPSHTGAINFPINHTDLSDENIALINTILKLDDFELLCEIEKDNKFIQSWLNYKQKHYATAAILARDALSEMEVKPNFNDSVYQLAYQLHYQNEINYYAQQYNLDAFLLAALIREESYFNPKAQSIVGAKGLMQVMPATAAYIAQKEGVPYNSSKSLSDPKMNINLGAAYLRYAKDILGNNDLLAVASYNGGPNAVKSWKKDLNYQNFDEFIENIPYEETKTYVKKVYRTYWIYMNMY